MPQRCRGYGLVMYRARIATIDDLDALLRLRARFMEELTPADADVADGSWVVTARSRIQQGLIAATVLASVVEDEQGELVASGIGEVLHRLPWAGNPSGRIVHVGSMYTVPEARGRGYGLAIIRNLVEQAHAHGVEVVELHAVDDTAERLYQRAGFVTRPGVTHMLHRTPLERDAR